jgi:hypothetical protein
VISIAHKTTLRTALLVMAILILTTYTAYRRESRLLRNSLLAQGHYVTQNVADSARNTFWTLNWTYIEKMLTHSMVPSHNPEEPQFFFARIVKGDGEIYLAGNHAENGMKMPDDFLVGEPRVVEDEVDPVTGHAGFLFSTPFQRLPYDPLSGACFFIIFVLARECFFWELLSHSCRRAQFLGRCEIWQKRPIVWPVAN